MPKISVIIPVYNTEKYLEKCLMSVINQTLKDIEIICINDNSADNSLNILEGFALKERRIKIIDLPQNIGVSASRNIGIDAAAGDYIIFIDSDDWWEPDLLHSVFSSINESDSDIAVFGSNYCDNDKISVNEEQLTFLHDVSEFNHKILKSNITYYAWDKLYKSDFIKNNNIKFIEQIAQTEDGIFSLECLSYNPKMIYIPKCFYNYRINREGSAMTKTSNLVTNQIEAFKALLDSKFYISSDNNYKKFCIDTLLGGIIYFYILTSKNKFSFKDFLELRKLAPYMRTKIPSEILQDNFKYTVLNNLTSANFTNGVSCLKKGEIK